FVDLYHTSGTPDLGGVTEAFNFTNFNSPLFQANGPRAFDTWSQDASPAPGSLPDYTTWRLPYNATTNLTPMPMMRYNINTGASKGTGRVGRAAQIPLRVWEPKPQPTRQVTLVQPLCPPRPGSRGGSNDKRPPPRTGTPRDAAAKRFCIRFLPLPRLGGRAGW